MLNQFLTIADYEARARETMPKALFDQIHGSYGAPTWEAYTNNLAAFEAIKLRPRVLVDVSKRDVSTEVLGQKISLPVMVTPMGSHQRFHPEGELASARAAGAAGTIMVLSIASSYTIEEVKKVATGPLWFHLYVFRDRQLTEILARRAEKAGYSAIVATVDSLGAVSTARNERERRYGSTPQSNRIYKSFVGIDRPSVPESNKLNEGFDPSFTWSDLDWLRSITSLPIVLKGIQTAEDAKRCLDYGINGISVSNHGGHDLQAARASVDALPEVVDAVGGQIDVFMDGGVRTGSDVLKAMAIGAKAVLIGRPVIWGISVDGEAGARKVFEILRDELDVAMAFTGVTDLRTVDRSLVELNPLRRAEDLVHRLESLVSLLQNGTSS